MGISIAETQKEIAISIDDVYLSWQPLRIFESILEAEFAVEFAHIQNKFGRQQFVGPWRQYYLKTNGHKWVNTINTYYETH